MTAATKVFDRKGVYQSELVRVTEPDGLSITLTGKPRESQDGKSFYVYFKHEGEDHYLTIENDAIKEYLDACPLNVPVTICAYGSREEALLTVEIEDRPPMEREPQTGPPAMFPEDDEVPVDEPPPSTTGSALSDMYLACLIAAREAEKAYSKEAGTPLTADVRTIATVLYIEMNRH